MNVGSGRQRAAHLAGGRVVEPVEEQVRLGEDRRSAEAASSPVNGSFIRFDLDLLAAQAGEQVDALPERRLAADVPGRDVARARARRSRGCPRARRRCVDRARPRIESPSASGVVARRSRTASCRPTVGLSRKLDSTSRFAFSYQKPPLTVESARRRAARTRSRRRSARSPGPRRCRSLLEEDALASRSTRPGTELVRRRSGTSWGSCSRRSARRRSAHRAPSLPASSSPGWRPSERCRPSTGVDHVVAVQPGTRAGRARARRTRSRRSSRTTAGRGSARRSREPRTSRAIQALERRGTVEDVVRKDLAAALLDRRELGVVEAREVAVLLQLHDLLVLLRVEDRGVDLVVARTRRDRRRSRGSRCPARSARSRSGRSGRRSGDSSPSARSPERVMPPRRDRCWAAGSRDSWKPSAVS